jgi:hypothetical protein
MASKSASISRLLVREIFVDAPNNSIVPDEHILISNGDGSTYWNSVSSILLISSFRTIVGNDSVSTFSADLNYNTLRVSTSAIPSTFSSYVDPTTSSLMLSLNFPPIIVDGTSASAVTEAIIVQSPNVISSSSLYSTIKFYGVQDMIFSTVNTQRSVYLGISTFTARGYSTLYGEMRNNLKVSVSSFSTSIAVPQSETFVSSIPFTSFSGLMSSVTSNVIFSSLQFDPAPFVAYINADNKQTSMSIEYRPNFIFSHMSNVLDNMNEMSSIKKITTFLQIGPDVFSESSTIRYITSQNIVTPSYVRALSNVYTDNLRMNISSYQFSTSVGQNPGILSVVYHVIENAYGNMSNVSLTSLSFLNRTEPNNSLFMCLNNRLSIIADPIPPSYPGYF